MLTVSPTGEEGNGNSFAPAISVSANAIAFESYASNLVSNDGNKVRDIFLWRGNNIGGSIQRISEGMNGIEANSESMEPALSGMGGHITFSSNATNLDAAGAEVSGVNVYLWERSSGKTMLISKDPKTGKGVGGARPSIDYNGYKIAFWSFASTLVEGDRNNLWDIFLYERNTSLLAMPLRRITMGYNGMERDQGDESSSRVVTPTLSGDGNVIAYSTTATNVVPDDNNKMQDVFVYDITTNTTTRVSVDSNGLEGNGDSPYGQGEKIALTANGSKIAFTTKASNFGVPTGNIMLYDMDVKKLIPITTNNVGYVSTPDLSRTGKYVVFGSSIPLDGRFNSSGLFLKILK
jgi:Tol biopolymer transport system component